MPAETPTQPTALDVALSYARRGWRVVPIPPGEKFPRGITAWQTEGSTDEAKIAHWWTRAPNHGIGIVTGPTSGIWVLDVDIAGDKAGDDTLAELVDAYGPLPDTYEVQTGSGGRHIYFSWPTDGQRIRNSASGRLGAGLDVRGDGGFVVAPPSVHASGHRYEAEASAPAHVAPAPGWLLAMLHEPDPDPEPVARTTTTPAGDRPGDLWAAATTWAQILEPDGWTLHHVDRDGEQHWTRPGKERRDGTSATTGYKGSDVLKVFTSSHPQLAADATYTKIGYLATTRHQGDHSAAASALAADGWQAPPQVTVTVTEPWPEPAPLPAPTPGPPFPLHALPAWTQAHVVAVADQVQVPVDLAAMQAIGALCAPCTGRAVVHVSPNWEEPMALYLAVAMRSGSGKSPTDRLVGGWLRVWQRERIEAAKATHQKATLKVRHARKRLTRLEGSDTCNDGDLFAAHDALTEAEAAVPALPRLLADDATPEAVAMLLRDHGQRLAIISTEADLFDMLLRGKPGQRQNMNVYLKAWGGDAVVRDRKGGTETGAEWTELTHPLLTIACSVQPSVLAQVRHDPEMASRGFAARFMVAVPDDLIGHRDTSRRFTSARLTTIDAYETEARRLATRWCTWANPAHLWLAPTAAGELDRFLAEVEPRLAVGADLEHLAEWANKLHASIVRYAGLLHLAEDRDPQAQIAAETVRRAIELGRYWLAHAATSEAAVDERVIAQAESIIGWVAGQGAARVTLAEVHAGHRRPGIGLDKVTDYVPPVELLIELGWLRPVGADGRAITSGRSDWRESIGIRRAPSPSFAVWPEVIGKPHRARIPRSPRTALWESAISLSPPTDTDTPSRTTRYADSADSAPFPAGYAPGALFDRPGILPPEEAPA